MRVSSDTSSPYFRSDYRGAQVYIDGALVRDVIEADDVTGEVLVISRNGFGEEYTGPGDMFARELRRGHVRIVQYGGWSCAASIGFDAWMANRINSAHADFMARTGSMASIDRKAIIDKIYDAAIRPWVHEIAKMIADSSALGIGSTGGPPK